MVVYYNGGNIVILFITYYSYHQVPTYFVNDLLHLHEKDFKKFKTSKGISLRFSHPRSGLR